MNDENVHKNNKFSFQVISYFQKMENDKERIRKRFNFNMSRTSTNSSGCDKSFLPTQQTSSIFGTSKNKLKKINCNDKNKNKSKSKTKHISLIQKNNIKGNNIRNKENPICYNFSANNSPHKYLSRKVIDIPNNKHLRNKSFNLHSYKKKDINPLKKEENKNKYEQNNQCTNNVNTISNIDNLNNYTNSVNTINNDNTYNNMKSYLSISNNNKYNINNTSCEYYINPSQNSILKTHSPDLFNKIVSSNEEININNFFKIYKNNIKNLEDIPNYNNRELEEEKKTIKDNKSINNTSFSASSKTSEIIDDALKRNINNESNDIYNVNENENCNEGLIQQITNENYISKNLFNLDNKQNLTNSKNKFDETIPQIFNPFNNDNNSYRTKTEVNNMGLLDDDEYNQENRKKMINNVSKYYFIEDIIKKNDNFISLSFKKLSNLNYRSKFCIFSFIFDNFKNFWGVSKTFRNFLYSMLLEKYMSAISEFESKYKEFLKLENYEFNIHEFIKPKLKRKKFQIFCLYLKAKIISDNEYFKKYGDIGLEISYKYKIKTLKNENSKEKTNRTDSSLQSYQSRDHIQEEYIQIYKFDLKKNKNYPMWLCSERDEIFNNACHVYGNTSANKMVNSLIKKFVNGNELYQKHLIYSSPIVNINENDYLVFRIDLIENNRIIDDISFNDICIEKIEKDYFKKTQFKQIKSFDKMRDCESEIAINVWHEIYMINKYNINGIDYELFIKKLKQYFGGFFDILEIKFDISKFVFIRMTLKARKIGILKSGIFCNKDIEIVDKNCQLVKECVSINCVNTFSMHKNLKIRQNTVVYFYLTE